MQELKNCPICQSSNISFLYQGKTTRNAKDPKTWPVYECHDCTHKFINPQPSWTELSAYYSPDYEPYRRSHTAENNDDEKTVEKAKQQGTWRHIPIPTDKHLLDVGCGAGFFLRIAEKLGAKVKGVEPSTVAVERGRSEGLDIFNGTLQEFVEQGQIEQKYDIITCNHALEHMPNPVNTLQNMKKLLAANGFIWISVPNADCAFAKDLTWHWHSTDLPYHIMQFTPKSLSVAAKLADLSINKEYTYSLPQGVKGSLISSLRQRWFIPQKISSRLISDNYINQLAEKLDLNKEGEAILIELTHN